MITNARLIELADEADAHASTVGTVLRLLRGEATDIRDLAKKHQLKVTLMGGQQDLPPMSFFCCSSTQGHDLRVLAKALRLLESKESCPLVRS